MDRAKPPAPNEGTPRDATTRGDADRPDEVREREHDAGVPRGDHANRTERQEANPPHTTRGKFTAPKFGSAGSGGAEYEGPLKKN